MPSVRVLGSGTGVPSVGRASPGLFLEPGEGMGILLDPGPGTVCRMAAQGIGLEEVDRVLVTHLHPDHTIDLMALRFARKNPVLRSSLPRLTVAGPPGTGDLLDRMTALYGGWLEPMGERLAVIELTEGPLPEALGLKGEIRATKHIEGSLGYRFDLPAGSLAVSGDSGPCDALVDLGLGAELFFLECSFPDQYPDSAGHLTPREAGAIAARANPRRLVLYHLYPWVKERAAIESVGRSFRGEVFIAGDGDAFTF